MHYLEAVCAEDSDVSWNSVTKLDLNNVASDQLFCVDVQFLAFTDHDCKLHDKHHVTSTHHQQMSITIRLLYYRN